MAFRPESNNPRERRAYAHTAIAKARQSGTIEDLEVAKQAVKNAGMSRKSSNSSFPQALAGAALGDSPTRVIASKINETLDPIATPRENVPLDRVGKYHALAIRRSPDFSTTSYTGAAMLRAEIRDQATGELGNTGDLMIHDLDRGITRQSVPVVQEKADVFAIRYMPDAARLALAGTVSKIQ